MTIIATCCKECGKALERGPKPKETCSRECKQAFNNRRIQRGGELYDLFRAMRRERDEAKSLRIWSRMCELELLWQREDEKERPGRRSYLEPKRAIAALMDKGRLPRGEVLYRPKAGRGWVNPL